MDEALSVGDVFFQAKCYQKFEEFKKQGKTIIFVSHDLSSISKYCDRVFLLNKGKLLGEGEPKEMIDAFKQVLVGQYSDHQEPAVANQNALEYGTRQAEILDFFLTDEAGTRTNVILKGTAFTLHMKVKINDHLTSPIFAFSIKNAKGVEITGTNTMVEKAFSGNVEPGMVKEITFTQRVNLQGGDYLISLGVTGYNSYNFEVYHRLYDVTNLTVVSMKDTVGYFDMESEIAVKDV